MISTKFRFSSRLFKRCFRGAKRFRAGKVTFLTTEDRGGKSHFAVVVSKKHAKKAVTRNRLRRQMYEIIRKRVLPYLEGKNVICLYNGDKNPQNSADLQKSFFEFLGFQNRRKKTKF